MMEIARIGNRYLQDMEPWKLAKTDLSLTGAILNTALQLCGNIAVAAEPFMPFMSKRLRDMLGLGDISWDMLGSLDIVAAGSRLATPELLFEKIEDSVIEGQMKRLEDIKEQNKNQLVGAGAAGCRCRLRHIHESRPARGHRARMR